MDRNRSGRQFPKRALLSLMLSVLGILTTSGCCYPDNRLVWEEPFSGKAINLTGQGADSQVPQDYIDIVRGLPNGDDALVVLLEAEARIIIFCHLPEVGNGGYFDSRSQTMQVWLTEHDTAYPKEEPFLAMPRDARATKHGTFEMQGAIAVETAIRDGKEEVKEMKIDLGTIDPIPPIESVMQGPRQREEQLRAVGIPRDHAEIHGIFRGRWIRPCKLLI